MMTSTLLVSIVAKSDSPRDHSSWKEPTRHYTAIYGTVQYYIRMFEFHRLSVSPAEVTTATRHVRFVSLKW